MSAGFAMLVPAAPGVRVLEVSEGASDAAEVLRSRGCVVTCARGSAPLAFAGGSFDVVLLSVALGRTRGAERLVRDLRSITQQSASWLAPGGRLVLLVPNPVFSLPVVASLIGAPGVAARGPLLPLWLSATRVCESVRAAGFEAVEAFAALPHAQRIKFLIPLDGPAGAVQFFRSLVPRSRHLPRRLAVQLAAIAASHGLLHAFAPAFGIVASKAAAR